MIKQRGVIKFFIEEGETGIEIHRRLVEDDGERAMFRNEVSRWIRDIKDRKTDIEPILSPGWALDQRFADGSRRRIEKDPQLSTRKLAHCLEIATSPVFHSLRNVLEMKCDHPRGIPDMLALGEEAGRHSAEPPDLLPCKISLLGSLKDKFVEKHSVASRTSFPELQVIISESTSETISYVFLLWQERLRKCIHTQGKYIDEIRHFR